MNRVETSRRKGINHKLPGAEIVPVCVCPQLVAYDLIMVCVCVRVCVCVCVCARARTQSCLTLCDPMDCNPPGYSAHGIFQAGILEWGAISSSRGLPNPGTEPRSIASPASAGRFFTTT